MFSALKLPILSQIYMANHHLNKLLKTGKTKTCYFYVPCVCYKIFIKINAFVNSFVKGHRIVQYKIVYIKHFPTFCDYKCVV